MINIIGGILGTSGYDSHTRNLANALYKLTECRLSTQLVQGWESMVNDAELDMITKKGKETDDTLIISTPHTWKLYTGLGKNIGYCVWEGDKVPVSWIEDFLNPEINIIAVPSKHTGQAIINTVKQHADAYTLEIINNKIVIIPHGVDKKIFNSQRKKVENDGLNDSQLETQSTSEEDNITKKMTDSADNHADTFPFTFVCNKGWRGTLWDRGGVQYVIKAFAEEFNKDENVRLLIKLNPSYMQPQILQQSIDNLFLPQNRAPININLSNIPFNKLKEFYLKGDCFVCATRAESFNLPGLEAMSCGLPVIQTNFGGQTDYMTKDNSLFIDYDLAESEEKPMYDSTQWAIPKIEDLRSKMRWAYENKEKIKEMGKQAEIDSNSWTWENSAKKLLKTL